MTNLLAILALGFLLGTRHATDHVVAASGLLSLGFGLFLAYQITILSGLFGDYPGWLPR